MELVFIDTETTGLDPLADEILSVAWAVTDIRGQVPRRTVRARDFGSLLFVPAVEPSAEVAEINGYTPELWAQGEARPFDERTAELLADVVANRYWVGSFPQFDHGFISAAMRRVSDRKLRPLTHHLIDLGSIAWPLVETGEITGINQSELTAHFLRREQQHSAAQDVRDMIEVYQHLIGRRA